MGGSRDRSCDVISHVGRVSQSEARDGAEFQDGGPHLHI